MLSAIMAEGPPPAAGPPYFEQVSTNIFLLDVFYMICAVAIIVGILGTALVDAAIVRKKNQVDTFIQKIVGMMIAAAGFFIIGFGIWMWQYYDVYGFADPLTAAIKDWWFAGEKLLNPSTFFNPKDANPSIAGSNFEVDVFQVFFVFFVTFIAFGAALLHSAGLERIKARAFYVMAFFLGAIVMPVVLYLTWGSASPLTNNGTHDYAGLFALYITVGVWAVILAWRLGPRLGTFDAHPRTSGPAPTDLSKATMGVLILMSAIPFIALGCGFIVPDFGYFGISLTSSSFGLALVNVFAAYAGGAIMGGILAYRKRNVFWAIIGPLTGYISGTALFDITKPWIMFLVALGGPICAYFTYNLLLKFKIDEPKVAPLVLGPGIYAALMPGIVEMGTRTGGFFGITEGEFAFQNAKITLGWQAAGLGVTIAIALVTGLIVIMGCEKTIGIRVSEEDEIKGLDVAYWDIPQD